jgi:hypothetical protein
LKARSLRDLQKHELLGVYLDLRWLDLTPAERTRQRLAEIEKAERGERDRGTVVDSPVKKRGHRQGRQPGSRKSRAAASGLPVSTVQRTAEDLLRELDEIAERIL